MNYMFGSDPETFITAYYRDDMVSPIPANVFFPDSGKGNCVELRGGGVHADNIMLEFNPKEHRTFWGMYRNLSALMEDAHHAIHSRHHAQLAKAFFKAIGLDYEDCYYAISPLSSIDIPKQLIEYVRTTNNKSFAEFGCIPDYNTYLRDVNPPAELENTVRVAGGHIMISAPDERLDNPDVVFCAVKWMDVLVMPKFMLGWTKDTPSMRDSKQRRNYYGKAGSFRPKAFPEGYYGIEYRTPGPEWTNSLTEQLCDSIQGALIESVERGMRLIDPKIDDALIDKAINQMDYDSICELKEMKW